MARKATDKKRGRAPFGAIGPNLRRNPLNADPNPFDYKDIATMRPFLTDKGKIRARRVTGLDQKRQNMLSAAVKRSREVALLPYTYVAGENRSRDRDR